MTEGPRKTSPILNPHGERTFLKTFSPAGSQLPQQQNLNNKSLAGIYFLPLCFATPSPSPLLPGAPHPPHKPPTPKRSSRALPRGIPTQTTGLPSDCPHGGCVCSSRRREVAAGSAGSRGSKESCLSPGPSHPSCLSCRQAREQD